MNTSAQLDALKSRVGFHEVGNNGNPFGPWQGLGSGYAWCDSFAQWGAVANGGFKWPSNCQFGYKGDSYCPFTIDHAKQVGIWRGPETNPKPGYQVLFDWEHNGVADHIGTVISNGRQSDGTIVTVEGNYQDQVMYVKRDRTYILGFVALEATQTQPTNNEEEDMTGEQSQQLHDTLAGVQTIIGWFAGPLSSNEPNLYNSFIEDYRRVKNIEQDVAVIQATLDAVSKTGSGNVDVSAIAKDVADELKRRLEQ